MRAAAALLVVLVACGDNPPAATTHELTAFGFAHADNPAVAQDVDGEITGDAVKVVVPDVVGIADLVASFASDGMRVEIGGAKQTSGRTANDFRMPVTYTVVAEDGSTGDYTVRVWSHGQTLKAITVYAFEVSDNATVLTTDATGVITGNQVAVTVPAGTPVTSLRAGYQFDGVRLTVGGVDQVEGITPNDFTNPVTYTVAAEDGTTADFTITVTVGS